MALLVTNLGDTEIKFCLSRKRADGTDQVTRSYTIPPLERVVVEPSDEPILRSNQEHAG